MRYTEMRISSLIHLLEKGRDKHGDAKVALVIDGSTKTFRNVIDVKAPSIATNNLYCIVASKKTGAEK